jgi:hypothetical protein
VLAAAACLLLFVGLLVVGFALRPGNSQLGAAGSNSASATLLPSRLEPIPPSQIPPPWKGEDIGNPPIPGSASFVNKTWTLQAHGRGLSESALQVYFVSQPMRGPCVVKVQVASRSDCIVGVMCRAGDGSYAAVSLVPDKGAEMVVFDPHGEEDKFRRFDRSDLVSHAWLRLELLPSNRMVGSASADGMRWVNIRSLSVPLRGDFQAGFFIASARQGTTGKAVLSQVEVGPRVDRD